MKKTGLSALLALSVLAGCGDGGEKAAQSHLQKAEQALQMEQFSDAKLLPFLLLRQVRFKKSFIFLKKI